MTAGFTDYKAADLGLRDIGFKGRQHSFGFGLTANVFQYRDFFLDTFLSARWTALHVENKLLNTEPSG